MREYYLDVRLTRREIYRVAKKYSITGLCIRNSPAEVEPDGCEYLRCSLRINDSLRVFTTVNGGSKAKKANAEFYKALVKADRFNHPNWEGIQF